VDRLSQFLLALAPVLAAIGGLELRHRGRAKELVEDRRDAEARADDRGLRLAAAEADAFRRLSLLRRVQILMIDSGVGQDPLLHEIERETSH